MDDPVANGQLELACRLGSVADIAEAIEEGADINCNGYSPMFLAIQNADRPVIEELVRLGADVAVFEVDPGKGDVVDQLMAMAPERDGPHGDAGGMAELDAKMIRAFHRMITNKGVAEPVLKGRAAEYEAFAAGLQSIAAEECHAAVCDFLELSRSATAGDAQPEAAFLALLQDGAQAGALAEITARYLVAAEEEQPGELLKDYLKERKKLG